jgi:hypothetical protein
VSGFGRAGCAVLFSVVASACGDLGDVQVPLVSQRRIEPALPRFLEAVTARAALIVDVGSDGSAGSCPVEYSSVLPPSIDPEARLDRGDRLIDGEGTLIDCDVTARAEAPDVFDVDVSVDREELPRFLVIGAMSTTRSSVVSLALETPDGSEVEADCRSEVIAIASGAVWFELSGCAGRSSDAALLDCGIEVTALFENCSD